VAREIVVALPKELEADEQRPTLPSSPPARGRPAAPTCAAPPRIAAASQSMTGTGATRTSSAAAA